MIKLIPRGRRAWLFAGARVIGALYLIAVVVLLGLQEQLIFHPTKLPADYTYRFEGAFDQRWIKDGDEKYDSLLFRAPGAPGTILYFHGNAGCLDDWGEVASEISRRNGWNVWIIDYPGYGRSSGKISSEAQLHQLGSRLLTEAKAEFGPNERIIIYGRSIGSGIAVKLASENSVAGLVLESPYLSMKSLVHELVNWVPSFLVRYQMRSDIWLPKVTAPILILHGGRDEVIPFRQGQALSRLNASVQFAPVAGGQHNDLSTYEKYWQVLRAFLDSGR